MKQFQVMLNCVNSAALLLSVGVLDGEKEVLCASLGECDEVLSYRWGDIKIESDSLISFCSTHHTGYGVREIYKHRSK